MESVNIRSRVQDTSDSPVGSQSRWLRSATRNVVEIQNTSASAFSRSCAMACSRKSVEQQKWTFRRIVHLSYSNALCVRREARMFFTAALELTPPSILQKK